MSEWTSLQDIMQDLSVAQGCLVPASLEICTNRGPPQLNISEEDSDEQAHYECDGGGDFTPFTNPDFELIKQMLNKVNEKDSPEDNDPVLNSDLNPLSTDFVPQKVQKKLNRNVALTSILQTKNSELAARRPVPINVIPVMFKRKSSETAKVKSESVSPLQVSSPEKYNQYTPTEQANEYYSKYLEKSKLRDQFQEDIWLIAERKMKEIDAKKKLAAEIDGSPGSSGFDIVNLPQHRHRLTGPCIVCSVASKHGYYFTEEPTIS